MNNFPDCMKSIEKMGTKSDTFTATKLCSCLFYQLAPTALLLFDKKLTTPISALHLLLLSSS